MLPSLGALIEFWITVADNGCWKIGDMFQPIPVDELARLPLGEPV